MSTGAIRLSTVESTTTIKTRRLDDGRFERVKTTTTTASTLEDLDLVEPQRRTQERFPRLPEVDWGPSLWERIFGKWD
jgi:hypothetical protein